MSRSKTLVAACVALIALSATAYAQKGGGSFEFKGGGDGPTVEDLGFSAPGEQPLEEPTGGGGQMKSHRLLLPGHSQHLTMPGQYSPTLGAYFVIRYFKLGPFIFPGARLVTYPEPGSPLRQLGLRPGDIISRLDGVRVRHYGELDRHYAETSVRYVRYPGTVRTGTIYIDTDLITP